MPAHHNTALRVAQVALLKSLQILAGFGSYNHSVQKLCEWAITQRSAGRRRTRFREDAPIRHWSPSALRKSGNSIPTCLADAESSESFLANAFRNDRLRNGPLIETVEQRLWSTRRCSSWPRILMDSAAFQTTPSVCRPAAKGSLKWNGPLAKNQDRLLCCRISRQPSHTLWYSRLSRFLPVIA